MTLGSEIGESLTIALAALRANKLRSGLTALGIVIGIVTVTLMGTAIEGINQSFKKVVGSLGTDVLYIQKFSWFSDEEWWRVRNRRDITLATARAIERQSTMARVIAPESFTRQNVRRGNRSAPNVAIVGVTDQNFLARGFSIAHGRFMTAAESEGARPVCVLGADTATQFFRNEQPLGQKINIGGNSFEIVGVMAPFDKFLGLGSDSHILIPITLLKSLFNLRPDVQILVKVADVKMMDDAREELRGILRKIRNVPPGKPDDFGINQQDAFIQRFNQVGGTLAMAGLFITGLSLFVGGIGIMNIMFVSVAERTKEIGIRKAIGAKRRTILIQFLIEAAAICLFGGLIGLAIAFPITLVMSKYLSGTMSITVALMGLLVALVTGIVSGFLPAWRASKMNPVDALRSE